MTKDRPKKKAGHVTKPGPGKARVVRGAPPTQKIDHVVLIIKENHSFDNYFGTFTGVNGMTLPRSPNPPTQDPDHRHGAWLTRKRTAVRLQFTQSEIPKYFSYAQQYTLCDNYFTDVAGPSSPNHLFLIAADSPIIDNPPRYRLPVGSPLFDLPSLPNLLEKKGLTWGNYGGYAFEFIKGVKGRNTFKSEQFATDAASGKLPNVSWVYAPHQQSEHPPDPKDSTAAGVGDVTVGMQWTVDQINSIVKGGLWPNTAIFITWDDWGGWYDHVDPPNVETWHDTGSHPAFDGTQFRYGSRVGCLVLGGYAKAGYISKQFHSHVSLLKFCETTFGLGFLNKRDSSADGMLDCFDFTSPASLPK